MRRVLAFLFGLVVLVGSILAALVVGSIGVLPFVVLPRFRRERYAIAGARVWAWVTIRCILFAELRIDGSAGLDDKQGALILCNHRSWLDPLLLMQALRSNGLSKREILWIPVIGFYGWISGAVYFDRRSERDRARARDEVLQLVASGARVQVFPEGKRSRDGTLRQRVSLTLARDCWERGIPVVPCAVWGSENAIPTPTSGAYPGARVRLVIGEAMWPAQSLDGSTFADEAWREVSRLLASLDADAQDP